MYSKAIKTLVICTFGAAMIAGCASSSPVASTRSDAQVGKVTEIETVAVVDQVPRGASSGGGSVITASSGPNVITVQFADGRQQRYVIEQQAAAFKIGQPVAVAKDGDRFTILSQQ